MTQTAEVRNYRLTGNDDTLEIPREAWYQTPVPRKVLKGLARRSDVPTLLNYALWLGLLAGSGYVAFLAWGTWYAVPAFFVYGVLYGSGAESRWHECSHGTSFRTRWLNEAFYHLASFMALKNPYVWRWSHSRHHTHTIIVGRDPEIAFPRPPDITGMILNLLHLKTGTLEALRIVRQACGILTPDEQDYVPEIERRKVFWVARIHVGLFAAVVAWSVSIGSWMPLMFIGLPTFYGSWLHNIMATTQHAGLAEDTPDHRLNTRTVRLNPVLRFIYSNMNYHIEHHMFPTVPFYALPKLHEAVKHDMPRTYDGLIDAFREIIPALLRQVKNPRYFVVRELPQGAARTPAYVPSPVADAPASGGPQPAVA